MIKQLVTNLAEVSSNSNRESAAAAVLTADPLDLLLYLEQVWDCTNPLPPALVTSARERLWCLGRFQPLAPPANQAWEHLGYSYVLENTRILQVFRRVVRKYRLGESLGVPSRDTGRWLDATESLLYGHGVGLPGMFSTSTIRPDQEAVRRNAYYRMFGMDLAFGTDENTPAFYEKPEASNIGFSSLFEKLLHELSRAISDETAVTDRTVSNDQIYSAAEKLRQMLLSRRNQKTIDRVELVAATALGWAELTVSWNSPVVKDLRADATTASDRLGLIGERVGLPAHAKSDALFSMASELSVLLRAIEAGWVDQPASSWVLYADSLPSGVPSGHRPIGDQTRRVISAWAAATGRHLEA